MISFACARHPAAAEIIINKDDFFIYTYLLIRSDDPRMTSRDNLKKEKERLIKGKGVVGSGRLFWRLHAP